MAAEEGKSHLTDTKKMHLESSRPGKSSKDKDDIDAHIQKLVQIEVPRENKVKLLKFLQSLSEFLFLIKKDAHGVNLTAENDPE